MTTDNNSYIPPKVWTWDAESGGRFANVNRPVSGATFDKALPVGKHPIQLYSQGTPNGVKVTILLEELLALGIQEAEYDAWLVNIFEGDQFSTGFVDLNPNSKIPAVVDRSTGTPIRVFESGAILLHLAEKFRAFIPTNAEKRPEMLSWLFWQMGSAPFLGGGFGHFYKYAPTKQEYPLNRYTMEVKRQLDVIDKHLVKSQYFVGDEYSIADIAIWPWYGQLLLDNFYGAAEFLDVANYGNAIRWAEEIAARPGVKRGRVVNAYAGEERSRLIERHDSRDFAGLVLK